MKAIGNTSLLSQPLAIDNPSILQGITTTISQGLHYSLHHWQQTEWRGRNVFTKTGGQTDKTPCQTSLLSLQGTGQYFTDLYNREEFHCLRVKHRSKLNSTLILCQSCLRVSHDLRNTKVIIRKAWPGGRRGRQEMERREREEERRHSFAHLNNFAL